MKRRRVFISFLGTNEYEPVMYQSDGADTTAEPVVFVQEALIRLLCKGWTRNDAVMIFRTEESQRRNWLDRPVSSGDEGTRTGLRTILSGMKYPMATNPGEEQNGGYIIPPGFDEAELWRIFKAVSDRIENGDEIYFDVTHAFRTIPLFATVLFNYCRFMKGSTVKGIYYGAFEKLGSLQDVRKIAPEKRFVPIVDMRSLVTLQAINVAASNFSTYGTVGTIGMQIDSTWDVDIDRYISDMRQALADLDFYMQTCRLYDIFDGTYMRKLRDSLENLRERGLNSAQLSMLDTIYERLTEKGFSEEETFDNIEAAVEWLTEYGMVQQALTLIREYVPSRIADMHNGESGLEYDDWYEIADNALKLGRTKLREKQSGIKLNAALRLKDNIFWPGMADIFNSIRNMRNDINHASGDEYSGIDDFKDRISVSWSKMKENLHNYLES